MKKMAAGAFKTNCLAVMDEVQAKHETVVITKHGKPVAKLVPGSHRYRRDLQFPQWQGCGCRRCRFARDLPRGLGQAQVILVDTHVVVWLAFDQGRLSGKARAAIDDARKNGDGLAISDIALLE